MQTPDQIRLMYRRTGDVFSLPTGPVRCLFDVADRTAFDAVIVGDYTLRYLAIDATLEREDSVTIGGVEYIVAAPPEQLNAHEIVAQLVKS